MLKRIHTESNHFLHPAGQQSGGDLIEGRVGRTERRLGVRSPFVDPVLLLGVPHLGYAT